MGTQTNRAQDRETESLTPASANEHYQELLRMALCFEKFEVWHEAHSAQSRSVAMDELCRDAAEVIAAAEGAGHFQKLPPGFELLIDFYRGRLLPPEDRPRLDGYPPNFVPCASNFISAVKVALMNEYPIRFLGSGNSDSAEISVAVRILAEMIGQSAAKAKSQPVSRLELDRRGKRLLAKSSLTLKAFAKFLGIPTSTAQRLDCWRDRPHKNHAGRKPRVRTIDPAKLDAVGADLSDSSLEAKELERLINEQAKDDRSDRVI